MSDIWFGTPKELGKFIERKALITQSRPAAMCIDGKCLHVNKGWYYLHVKLPDVMYMKCCLDCKKILDDKGDLLSHDSFLKLLSESSFTDEERKVLLLNYEEVNGIN